MPDYLYIIEEGFPTLRLSGKPVDFNGERYLKIGVASDPRERLKQLQTSNPRLLFLVGIRPIRSNENREKYEASVHELFSNFRVCGEWFLYRDEIIDWYHKNMLYGDIIMDGHRIEAEIEKVFKLSNEDYFYHLGRQNAYQEQKKVEERDNQKLSVFDQLDIQVSAKAECTNK